VRAAPCAPSRQQHADRLKALSLASAAAGSELRRKLDRAAAVLRLAEVCRRLEGEAEKVLPFWSTNEAVPVEGTAAAAAAAAAAEEQGAAVGAEAMAEASGGAGGPAVVSAAGAQRPSLAGGGGGSPGGGRLSARALRDDGTPVDEWDYLSRWEARCGFWLLGFEPACPGAECSLTLISLTLPCRAPLHTTHAPSKPPRPSHPKVLQALQQGGAG
jgi:hypothetical protein